MFADELEEAEKTQLHYDRREMGQYVPECILPVSAEVDEDGAECGQ